MGAQSEDYAAENKYLRRCINDLLSVLALPALWSGHESAQIIRTLADTLVSMLDLELVYVTLNDPRSEAPVELLRLANGRTSISQSQELAAWMRGWIRRDPQEWPRTIPNAMVDGEVVIQPVQLGLHGQMGLIVTGAQRANFPGDAEKLILSVAVNQASVGLQEGYLLSEQKRLAHELDRRVAQRTAELAEANQELRTEISVRRKVEGRLVESEALLLEAQRLSHTGSWNHDFASNTVSISPEMGRIFEIAPGEDTTSAKFFFSRIHPEDEPAQVAQYMNAVSETRGFDSYYRIQLPNGSIKHIHNTGHPKFKESGEIIGFVGTAIDVTEQHHARAALEKAFDEIRRSEAKLRQVIDAIPTLAWCNLPEGPNEFLNKVWHDYTGLSPEESHGWGWQAVFHPEDLPPLMKRWGELLASGEPGEIEARIRRHDGVHRWFLVRVQPLRDEAGNIVRWYGTSTDIEDRKEAEEALKRSEAFLAEGQHLSRTGSFSWRVETDDITWSEQLYRIFEFDPGTPITSELIGSRFHPDDFPLLKEMIEGVRAGIRDLEHEHRLLMPDRSVKYLHLIAHACRDHDGSLEYLGAVQDVTQRRQSEEALARARSELAKVARVTSLGVLTASMAHEVNQPLSGIMTNASTCLRMLSADPPNVEGARETVRRTLRDGNRAADVISRLRTLYSKKDPAFDVLDLNDATREVVSLSLSELQRNRVILRQELAEALPLLTGDRIQLQQVILNLLRNASDAMSTVQDRPRDLLITTEGDQDQGVCLSVKDAGIGFDPQSADKLFQAFYTTKDDGMGIGLSISRSIIEAHQGRLWATPNDGPGATVCFVIPCRPGN
jgi:PAS domain S-box-containing protein